MTGKTQKEVDEGVAAVMVVVYALFLAGFLGGLWVLVKFVKWAWES